MTDILSRAAKAIVRVGAGRGFVVEDLNERRYVITAAHCLPHMPPAIGGISHIEERTYQRLLGPLGQEPDVWCECLFVDPISDVAILGRPDGQELYEQARAYDTLVDKAPPLSLGQPTWQEADAVMLATEGRIISLDGRWLACEIIHVRESNVFWFESIEEPVAGGMSGSPVITPDGIAFGIGVTDGGPHPNVLSSAPTWFMVRFCPGAAVMTEP
jgi:hypothetical protein